MADLCVPYTGFPSGLTLNPSTTDDRLVLGAVTGLDGRPIRSTIVPRGGTDGGQKLTSKFGPRLIVFSGDVHIDRGDGQSVNPFADMTDYLTRVTTLTEAWRVALEGALNSAFTLAWTPTGGAARTLSCTYGFEGAEWTLSGIMVELKFSFGLVAEIDP